MPPAVAAGFKPGGHGMPPPRCAGACSLSFSALYLLVFFFLAIFIGTMTFNLALNSTRLGDDFQMESTLSPFMMTWIGFSNLMLVLLTVGLFYPWAHGAAVPLPRRASGRDRRR